VVGIHRVLIFTLVSNKKKSYYSAVKICHSCTKELSISRGIARKEICPSCGADLHCCLNCRHYDRSASKQCRETIAEMVKEKTKANFCDHFAFSESRTAGMPTAVDQARNALGELFKK
jgi:hypothetical protein